MINIYKLEVMIIDHNDFGLEEIISILENHHDLDISIMQSETKEIEWTDEHPLNKINREIKGIAFKKLFK